MKNKFTRLASLHKDSVLRRNVLLFGAAFAVFSGCQSCGNVGTVGNGMKPQTGVVSGTVMVASDANAALSPQAGTLLRPVSGARVRIVGSDSKPVSTDEEGRFRIEVEGGEHLIIAEKVDAEGNKHMLAQKVVVRNGFETSMGTPLILEQAGAIAGVAKLSDAKDDGHQGIVVQLEGTDLFALTDEQGSYTLPGVPAGRFVWVPLRMTKGIISCYFLPENGIFWR